MMMDHDKAHDLLDDLVDGELGADRRDALLAHVQQCEQCTAEVDFLVSLRDRVQALPREVAPPRDLWAGIAARIEEQNATGGTVIPIGRRAAKEAGPGWRRWGALAVAASVLVVVSSAVTIKLTRSPQTPAVAMAPAAAESMEQRPPTSLAAFEPTEREYQAVLAELEAEFRARRGSMSPETVAVVEENLRIIDVAIEEIRTALLADSTSVELPLLLTGVYRSKLELLESSVRLHSQT